MESSGCKEALKVTNNSSNIKTAFSNKVFKHEKTRRNSEKDKNNGFIESKSMNEFNIITLKQIYMKFY